MNLTDFLLARIAEDEEVARAAVIPAHSGYRPHPELRAWRYSPWEPDCSGEVEYEQTPEMLAHKYAEPLYVTCDNEGLIPSVGEDVGPHIARHDPARVLAECEAKRRIVEHHRAEPFADEPEDLYCRVCEEGLGGFFPCPTLRALALPYADHPDYRQEWRP